MKWYQMVLGTVCAVLLVFNSRASVLYVDLNCTNPTPPYAGWPTAATNIQDAVDAASAGDTVLVTNGIYTSAGTLSGDGAVCCVVVTNAVTIQSVNGPTATSIDGGNTNRCIYLADGSFLSGFTLTNGNAGSGGGVYSASANTMVSNCILIYNTAGNGGGAYNGTLANCTLYGNGPGGYGGAAEHSTLNNCLIFHNPYSAVANCTLNNCLLAANGEASSGGSTANFSTLNNCTLANNGNGNASVTANGCTLVNSIIYDNSNGIHPDCYQCRLTNCCTSSLVNNGVPINCITNSPGFMNLLAGNYHLKPFSRCIDAGTNIYAPPGADLDGNPRIAGAAVDIGCYEVQSPFQGIAHYVSLKSTNAVPPYTNWLTAATNIQDAVASAQEGEFVVADDGIYASGGTVIYGSETNRVALTNAITLISSGDFPAAIILGGIRTRCVYVGSNSVLSGFTLTNGQGVIGGGDLVKEESGGGAWCENSGVISNSMITGNRLLYGYGGGVYGGQIYGCIITNNWLQPGQGGGGACSNALVDCIIENNWVSGGNGGGGALYSALTDCKVVGNTSGNGGGTAFCTLIGCIVSNNIAIGNGGGMYMGLAINSLVSSNYASGDGGGAYSTTMSGNPLVFLTLSNCVLCSNYADGIAGAVYQGGLEKCVVSGNSTFENSIAINTAMNSCLITNNISNAPLLMTCNLTNCVVARNRSLNPNPLIDFCLVNNCTVITNTGLLTTGSKFINSIIYYNADTNIINASYLGNCCVPALGSFTNGGNFTNPPLFAVQNNSDFHLQSNSPCINSGNNAFVASSTDLDGNPRISGGTVDIGAYEYQNPASVLSYAWAQQYGLPTDGSADDADTDGTGMNNWQKWIAGLNPTNPASVLAMQSPSATNNAGGITVTWQSVNTRTYYLQRATDLTAQPPFSAIQSNLVGQAGTTSYTDTTATNGGPYFYRVGVQ